MIFYNHHLFLTNTLAQFNHPICTSQSLVHYSLPLYVLDEIAILKLDEAAQDFVIYEIKVMVKLVLNVVVVPFYLKEATTLN